MTKDSAKDGGECLSVSPQTNPGFFGRFWGERKQVPGDFEDTKANKIKKTKIEEPADIDKSTDISSLDATMQVAQEYYDSDTAFQFYKAIWGGECIHVGLYNDTVNAVPMSPERIRHASAASLAQLLAKRAISPNAAVMDMGSGYGGCARHLAQHSGCQITCVDLSKRENAVNLQRSKESGLDNRIKICNRSFSDTGEDSGSFDLILSQDSFLHAGEHRAATIAEAARLLRPGGSLVFTDIMQADDADPSALAAVYKRIHLDDMGSVGAYDKWAQDAGLKPAEFDDRTEDMATHYATVRSVLEAEMAREDGEFGRGCKDDMLQYARDMLAGLDLWTEAAHAGQLRWGFLTYDKPNKTTAA